MGILLKNILAVLPEGNDDVVKETDIYIEGSRIAAIGMKPSGFVADRVVDGKDRLAIPGLINCHTHSYMSFMRNVADDLSFMDWLFGSIDPIEQQMTDEDTYWGACLAIIEMMKSGTTCFNDMQMNIHQTTRAVKESGMRAVICRGLVGSGNDEAGQIRLKQAMKKEMRLRTVTDLPLCWGLMLLIPAMMLICALLPVKRKRTIWEFTCIFRKVKARYSR